MAWEKLSTSSLASFYKKKMFGTQHTSRAGSNVRTMHKIVHWAVQPKHNSLNRREISYSEHVLLIQRCSLVEVPFMIGVMHNAATGSDGVAQKLQLLGNPKKLRNCNYEAKRFVKTTADGSAKAGW
eukprot:364496-Chlamydomonas_euryale.AAC.14